MGLAKENHNQENKLLQSSGLAPKGTANPGELESKSRPPTTRALPSFSPVRPWGSAALLGVSPESEERLSLALETEDPCSRRRASTVGGYWRNTAPQPEMRGISQRRGRGTIQASEKWHETGLPGQCSCVSVSPPSRTDLAFLGLLDLIMSQCS